MSGDNIGKMMIGFFDHDSEYAVFLLDPEQKVLHCNGGAQRMFARPREDMQERPCPFEVARHGGLSENVLLVGPFPEEIKGCWSYDTVMTDANGRSFPAHVSVTTCARGERNCPDEHLLVIVKDTGVETAKDRLRNIILEVANLANQPREMVPMLDDIMHVLCHSLDIPLAYVCLTMDGETFHVTSTSGLCSCALGTSCLAQEGDGQRTAGCLEARTDLTICHEPLFSHRISDFFDTPENPHDPIVLIHVPLLSDDTLLGILHVGIPEHLLHVYLHESQVLSLISNKLTSSIRNKQLEKGLQEYAEHLEDIVQTRTDQLREKDAQLVQSGKLATLGEMATGIAHEINQPLGGISLMTQGIERALEKGKLTDALLTNRLHSIHEQIERINKIINHLRIFGRQAPETKSPIDVNKPLHDVLDLIGMQLQSHNIAIDLKLEGTLPPVLGDANRLEQVFLNIIGNARDALEEQEKRVCRLKENPKPPDWVLHWKKKIHIRTALVDGNVTITIRDTACGIPERVMDKIFEPFFTTKEVGKGTGLGLSISYGIVKEFKGELRVYTKLDEGSTFVVSLPPIKEAGPAGGKEPTDD